LLLFLRLAYYAQNIDVRSPAYLFSPMDFPHITCIGKMQRRSLPDITPQIMPVVLVNYNAEDTFEILGGSDKGERGK